jgi:hypothetical protein
MSRIYPETAARSIGIVSGREAGQESFFSTDKIRHFATLGGPVYWSGWPTSFPKLFPIVPVCSTPGAAGG